MAQKGRVALQVQANEIRDEVVVDANTAIRVGQMLVDINDSLLNIDDDGSQYNQSAHVAIVTGNPHAVNASDVGLGNCDNTTDLLKPISTATQSALDDKVDDSQVLTNVPAGALFTDTVYNHPTGDGNLHVPANSTTNNGKVLTASAIAGTYTWETPDTVITDHTGLSNIGTNTHVQIDTHIANTANPHAVDAADVGLGNCDNTSDANKPVSSAQQTALDGKVDDAQVLTNVPAGALFTDTVYTHPTGDGNLHVPANSTTNNGKVLTASAVAGVYTWETIPAGVTDHTLLSNIGTNTHVQIDTHLALTDEHIDWSLTNAKNIHADNYTDTIYSHPTGDGNLHVPANSTTNDGKVLTASAVAGVYTWETSPAGVTDHTLLTNIGTNTHAQIDTHIANVSNPHSVDAADVGLGNVNNTSDANKPVSTLQQTALDGKVDDAQVLTNVPAGALFTDTVYTHPTTDGNKHVPANSTTNDGKVLTASAVAGVYTWETPVTGVTDHTLLTNIGTNTHAQIDTHIALADEHIDWSLTNAKNIHVDNYTDSNTTDHTLFSNIGTNTHAQIDTHIANTANPHSVDKADVALGNCDNTSDVNKPVSTAQQTALDALPYIKAITIEDPIATDSVTMFFTDVAITITQINDVIQGSTSVTWNVSHATTRNGTPLDIWTADRVTSSAAGAETTTFNDATIPAGSWVWLAASAISGTPTEFCVTVEYTID